MKSNLTNRYAAIAFIAVLSCVILSGCDWKHELKGIAVSLICPLGFLAMLLMAVYASQDDEGSLWTVERKQKEK